VPAADLRTADGMVRRKAGGTGIKFADLLAGQEPPSQARSQGLAKEPKDYTIVGKPLPRPDVLLLPGAVR
jgi:nicotinate dehydrogenase subunit B